MQFQHIGHTEITKFAEDHVNLKREDASAMRDQINRLREKIEGYIKEHPDAGLERILLSGSLAKGTALKTINDADVAVYIRGDFSSYSLSEMLEWLAERLRKAFANLAPDQVEPQTYSIKVSFRGSGLNVDIVPVISDGNGAGGGYLVSQEDGSHLYTNIPQHLQFIRKRKQIQERHFAQIVRLVKYWVRRQKELDDDFRFKSFLVELIVAYLVDQESLDCGDYPNALAKIFNWIGVREFSDTIVFDDYYDPAIVKKTGASIHAFDPVNAENNVARLYGTPERSAIVDAAFQAVEAIDGARYAPTKGESVAYWQVVFGRRLQS